MSKIKKHSEIYFDRLRNRDESKLQQRRLEHQKRMNADRRVAQRLIRTGEKTVEQWLLMQIDEEPRLQQDHVAIYGECSFGCCEENLTTGGITGEMICRWTRRPCKKRETKTIRELYSGLNK